MGDSLQTYARIFLAARDDLQRREKTASRARGAQAGRSGVEKAKNFLGFGKKTPPPQRTPLQQELDQVSQRGQRSIDASTRQHAHDARHFDNRLHEGRSAEEVAQLQRQADMDAARLRREAEEFRTPGNAGNAGPAPGRSIGRGGIAALGVAGAGAAGAGGYLHGKQKAEAEARTNRNLAFGAGVATGTAAPHVYRHLDGAARNLFHRE